MNKLSMLIKSNGFDPTKNTKRIINFNLSFVLTVAALSALFCQTLKADGGKDISGRPEGAYNLSEMETINFFNGSLTFQVPIVKLGGRGAVGYSAFIGAQNLISTTQNPVTICDPDGSN